MKHFATTVFFASAVCLASLPACGVGALGSAAAAPTNTVTITGPHSTVNPTPSAGGNDTVATAGPYLLQGRFSPGNANVAAPQTMTWGHSAVVARITKTTQVSVSLTDVQGTGAFSLSAQNESDSTAQTMTTSFDPSVSIPSLTGLDANAVYTVTFRKHIEANYATAVFAGFSMDTAATYLTPPASAARRIEVIGDSISAGYGDLGTVATCNATADNEDSEKAYGPVAAAALGADLHLLAWSGKGVYLNNDHTTTETMPMIWTRAVATDANTAWDTSSWTPQVVVINLGTNDFTNTSVDQTTFVSTYTAFLGQLRSAYPKAEIIVSMGPMLQGDVLTTCIGYLQQAISARQAAGDKAVSLLQYPTENTNTGAGCAYHPNTGTQATMASALVAKINTLVQW